MTSEVKKRGRPQKVQNGLNKSLIVTTAKKMMAQNGSIPSIRKLSAQLNVDAMAIYYYFKNKDALLEAITTSLIEDIHTPADSGDWRKELLTLSKSYLATLSKYDGLLQTLLSMKSDSPAEVFIGRFEKIITPLKLEKKQQKAFLDLLVDYLHGFSLAMSCDKSNTLTIDDIDISISFLFNGLDFQND
ncbi:transcriptional regulator [Pseudoalteromonas luteoviolacea]|uniref:Transcriptional regulator n=1 Tax=Pseudoalteromonas luteoviolacea TaxID=43657 RepID=A0A1C0TSE5_9GAMM|nr:helix-turn-helix domain-containing protein [Pseudoalteromonas luteoviolacea]OCQ22179.1 transcriptional regulator [Pseudoalteromonas luteoviolacea]